MTSVADRTPHAGTTIKYAVRTYEKLRQTARGPTESYRLSVFLVCLNNAPLAGLCPLAIFGSFFPFVSTVIRVLFFLFLFVEIGFSIGGERVVLRKMTVINLAGRGSRNA